MNFLQARELLVKLATDLFHDQHFKPDPMILLYDNPDEPTASCIVCVDDPNPTWDNREYTDFALVATKDDTKWAVCQYSEGWAHKLHVDADTVFEVSY
jgi:hypothetical protein